MTNRQIIALIEQLGPGTRLRFSHPKEACLNLFDRLQDMRPHNSVGRVRFGRMDRPRLNETHARIYVDLLGHKKETPSDT